MPRTLKDVLLCVLLMTTIVVIVGACMTIAPHLPGWLDNADQFAAQQRQSAVSQARAVANIETITAKAVTIAANVETITADVLTIVASVDTESLNDSLHNLRTATARAASVTGDVAAITADERANLPKVNKAAFELWKHADRTIGHADDASQHLDDAAKAEAQQQAAIAGETVATLKASHEVVTNLNAITADGKEAADYEKKQITTPLTKMQRLGRSLEDFGAMVLGHLL